MTRKVGQWRCVWFCYARSNWKSVSKTVECGCSKSVGRNALWFEHTNKTSLSIHLQFGGYHVSRLIECWSTIFTTFRKHVWSLVEYNSVEGFEFLLAELVLEDVSEDKSAANYGTIMLHSENSEEIHNVKNWRICWKTEATDPEKEVPKFHISPHVSQTPLLRNWHDQVYAIKL